MPVPARIDEACGRMDEQAEATERTLSFQAGHEIVGQRDALESRAEHELAGVEDECLVARHLDELGQLLLLRLDVDERIAGVAEDAEVAVDAHIEARWLHELGVERLDPDAAFGDESADRSIGEDHTAILGCPSCDNLSRDRTR